MSKEQVEVTVIKRGKVLMPVTVKALKAAAKHFKAEGWVEATEKEKENFYKGKLVVKKQEPAKQSAKPKAAETPTEAKTEKK